MYFMKRIELKAKFCENSTATPVEFEEILAWAREWPEALISAGAWSITALIYRINLYVLCSVVTYFTMP